MYKPTHSPIDVSFAEMTGDTDTVYLSDRGYQISWSYFDCGETEEKTDPLETVENDLSVETEAVSFDNARGNVAFQGSVSTGITGGTPSVSLTFFQANSNAPDIYKLEGIGYQVGGSIGVPVGILPLAGGLDFNIIPGSREGEYFYGTTKSIGVGIPGMELHTEWGNTATLPVVQFNIFDSIDQFCISIMEW